MQKVYIFCLLFSSLMLTCRSQVGKKIDYPFTKELPSQKEFHGQILTDPYNWLDEPEKQEVKNWVKEQDSLTQHYIRSLPEYEKIKQKVQTLMQISGRSELPTKANGKYFYLKDGADRKWNLYVKSPQEPEPKRVFGESPPFNPRAAFFQIPSPDGKYLALGLSTGYFDWKILNTETGKMLSEKLSGVGLGETRLVWSTDSKGFFYTAFNKTDAASGKRSELMVKYHSLNTKTEKDQIVFRPKSDGAKLQIDLCRGGNNVFITEREGAGTSAEVYYKPVNQLEGDPITLIKGIPASFIFLGNDGPLHYFETDHHAPNGKIVGINIRAPEEKDWKTIVLEGKDPIMGYQSAGGTLLPLMAGDHFVLPFQKDLKLFVQIFDRQGNLVRKVDLPSGGLYFNTNGHNAFSGNREDNEVLIRFIGITEPNTIFSLDVKSGNLTTFSRAQTAFNAEDYTSEIVFCESKDGTRIPISLTYKKGLSKNGKNPLLLQVYGAIAFTNYPYFQGDYITWLEMGGIHAVAHIRGGGAFGAKWHQDGIARKKQNGIDDYIAAIRWVAKNNYTSPDLIVINGTSAGTIPVGAVLTQAPELIGAAVLHYGMLDLINYAEKFSKDANHAYMIPELGQAAVKEDFKVLNAYSPYQKLEPKHCYPPVLALTSEVDTPMDTDSYKFIAKLQNGNARCKHPHLLQMAWGSQHSGFGSQQQSPVVTFADEIAFLVKVLNLPLPFGQ